MSVTLRPARAEDGIYLIAWNAAMALETEQKKLDPSTLARGVQGVFDDPRRGRYFIAERDGQGVGALLITYEWSDWRCGDIWWIQSVYVVPQARRAGVFRAMYERVQRDARAASAVGLRLYVETENARAQATYSGLGMSRCHYFMYEQMIE